MNDSRASLPARLKGPAFAFAVLLLVATVVLWLLAIPAQRESYLVNLAGTLVFITAASLLIAIMSIRSFFRTGAWPVLWLGAGSLAFGLAVPLSNAHLALFGPNAGVTMHNLGALVAAALHVIGAFFTVNGIAPHAPGPPRASVVRQVFGGTLILIALIAAGAALDALPAFFVQGEGGTPLRQMIVALDTALFLIAGIVFLRHYSRTRTLMVYWYALGLLLTSLGLAGILLITATGTPLNWMGRVAQWIGGLYLLVAAWVTWSEARARQAPAGDVLAGYFLRSEASLRHLFNSIQDAIIVTDNLYRITFWNRGAEATYGWTAAEVAGRPARDVLQTEWLGGGSRAATTVTVEAGGFSQDEVIQHHRDGRRITILSSVSGFKDDSGRVLGAVAVNRDVTERRLAEEEIRRLNAGLAQRAAELEASNRELEAFAYSVSHDLRAPLRGIAGYAQALDEDYAVQLDASGRDYLRALRQNAQRMGKLIDDLLALSRVGRQQVERVPVDMAEVARAAWAELAAEATGRAVELRVAPMPPATADPTLVRQVYANLLSNALKFTRRCDRAVIELGCDELARSATTASPPTGGAAGPPRGPAYYVRDNGIGFEMEHAEKVFGLFQRLHRVEDYEGTGIGLAIAQRIVERHGGRAWAVSEPGRGATFCFTLGDDTLGRTG